MLIHFLVRARPPIPNKPRVAGHTFGRGAWRREGLRARRLNFVLLASCLVFQTGTGPELKQVALADREIRAALDNSRYHIEFYPEFLEMTAFRFGLD
jgi:hypothetical protein